MSFCRSTKDLASLLRQFSKDGDGSRQLMAGQMVAEVAKLSSQCERGRVSAGKFDTVSYGCVPCLRPSAQSDCGRMSYGVLGWSLLAHSNSKSTAWRLRRLAPTAGKMSSLRDYTASSDERRLLIICVYLRSSVVHEFVCKLLFEYRH